MEKLKQQNLMNMKKINFLLVFVLLFAILFIDIIVLAEETLPIDENNTENITTEIDIVRDIEIKSFFPTEVKIGDAQLNIQVQNNKNETINSLIALVSGKGFSTYNVVPAENVESGEKAYIFVLGNFKEAEEIILTIKIENEIFYQNVSVIDDQEVSEDLNELMRKEEEKRNLLNNFSSELEILKRDYNSLEEELANKKENDYDVSRINLEDLRRYILDSESDIFVEDSEQAKIDIRLAEEEYNYQKNELDNAKEIPTINKVREYAIIFTTLAGAFIMIFTLYELLKRKGSTVVGKISDVGKKVKGGKKVKKF